MNTEHIKLSDGSMPKGNRYTIPHRAIDLRPADGYEIACTLKPLSELDELSELFNVTLTVQYSYPEWWTLFYERSACRKESFKFNISRYAHSQLRWTQVPAE